MKVTAENLGHTLFLMPSRTLSATWGDRATAWCSRRFLAGASLLAAQLLFLALLLNRSREGCAHFRTARNRADATFFELQLQTSRRRLDATRRRAAVVQHRIAAAAAGHGAEGAPYVMLPLFSRSKQCVKGPTSDEAAPWVVNTRQSRFASVAELESAPGRAALAELGLARHATGTREEWDYVALWRAITDAEANQGSSLLVFATDWGVLGHDARRKGLPRCAPLVARLALLGNEVHVSVPTHALVRGNSSRGGAGAGAAGAPAWVLQPRGAGNMKLTASTIDPSKSVEKAQLKKSVTVRRDALHFLPPDLYERFDFVWSASALERFASRRLAHRFVLNALGAVKPEGFAMFLLEFDLGANATALAQTVSVQPGKPGSAAPLVEQRILVWSWRAVRDLVDDLKRLGYLPSVVCWRAPNATALLAPVRRPRMVGGGADVSGAARWGDTAQARAALAAKADARLLRPPDDFVSLRVDAAAVRAELEAESRQAGREEEEAAKDEEEDGEDGEDGGTAHGAADAAGEDKASRAPPVLTTLALIIGKPRWWGPVADQGRLWGEGQLNPGIRQRNYSLAVRAHEAALVAAKAMKAKCKKLSKAKKKAEAKVLGCPKPKEKKKKKKKRRRRMVV
jgi:hypothetical protein